MLEIFQKAEKGKYALGAFNFSNLEQLKAIVQAGQALKSPLILATSQGESSFLGKEQARALVSLWAQKTNLPLVLHLDHGQSLDLIKEAIEAGYDSIHFDGSGLSLEENIKKTKEVVDYARQKGIKNIEGELGYLRGSSEIHQALAIKEADLTEPDQALRFVEETGVDSLAIAIGNIHGINLKGTNPPLFLDRLSQIKEQIGSQAALVLHGGSGTPSEDIQKAIQLGIVKINVNTELRLAYSQALREFLVKQPQEIKPYKIMASVVGAVQKVVEEKIKLFGSENRL